MKYVRENYYLSEFDGDEKFLGSVFADVSLLQKTGVDSTSRLRLAKLLLANFNYQPDYEDRKRGKK